MISSAISNELTAINRSIMNNWVAHLPFNQPEERSAFPQILRSTQPFKYINSAQRLRPRLFKPPLFVPQPSLQPRCTTQVVCVIDCV